MALAMIVEGMRRTSGCRPLESKEIVEVRTRLMDFKSTGYDVSMRAEKRISVDAWIRTDTCTVAPSCSHADYSDYGCTAQVPSLSGAQSSEP
jgi:hypothetical protein